MEITQIKQDMPMWSSIHLSRVGAPKVVGYKYLYNFVSLEIYPALLFDSQEAFFHLWQQNKV